MIYETPTEFDRSGSRGQQVWWWWRRTRALSNAPGGAAFQSVRAETPTARGGAAVAAARAAAVGEIDRERGQVHAADASQLPGTDARLGAASEKDVSTRRGLRGMHTRRLIIRQSDFIKSNVPVGFAAVRRRRRLGQRGRRDYELIGTQHNTNMFRAKPLFDCIENRQTHVCRRVQ